MKCLVNILLFICVTKTVVGMKKCGILADTCQLLNNGEVFWPLDWNIQCNRIPLCPKGYALHKEILGDLRVCCCKVKRIHRCPDCDMSNVDNQSFSEWIDLNLEKNAPADGICDENMVKRIFLGRSNQLDKCCCEPKNSPFANKFSTTE